MGHQLITLALVLVVAGCACLGTDYVQYRRETVITRNPQGTSVTCPPGAGPIIKQSSTENGTTISVTCRSRETP